MLHTVYLCKYQVTKVHQKNYDFPPIYFCLSSWKNDKELLALDMTELASKYMYSLVFEERLDEADYDQAKSEFEEFAAQHNFTYYREALVHGSWSLDQFESYQCVGCSKITHLFAMKAKKACYQIEFPTVSAAEGARSIFAAEFRHPSDSTPNNYLIIGADHRTAYFYDLISVSAGHTYDVRLTAQQDKSFPKPPDNFCKTKAEVESENYNQQLCFDDCFVNHYASSYNCQPISNDDKIINPDRESDICSTKHGSLTKPREEVKEPDTLTVTNFIKEVTEKCQSKCIYPCESISYEFTLTDKSNTNKANTTTIFFMLEYARKGILTYEEIPTLSFQSAVSNVGGQLGLWMGLSIVSLFQLLSYFINCFIPRAIMSS